MKNKIVSNQPQKVATYPEITPSDQDAVECVNEIFKSPLTGAYNWDYIVVEDRIKNIIVSKRKFFILLILWH